MNLYYGWASATSWLTHDRHVRAWYRKYPQLDFTLHDSQTALRAAVEKYIG